MTGPSRRKAGPALKSNEIIEEAVAKGKVEVEEGEGTGVVRTERTNPREEEGEDHKRPKK